MSEKIQIQREQGADDVRAVVRGLFAIHPMVARDAYVGCGNAWTVTHVPSGAAVARRCSPRQARHLLRRLPALPVGWDILFVSGNQQYTMPAEECEIVLALLADVGYQIHIPEVTP
jgi:hypothetical protein